MAGDDLRGLDRWQMGGFVCAKTPAVGGYQLVVLAVSVERGAVYLDSPELGHASNGNGSHPTRLPVDLTDVNGPTGGTVPPTLRSRVGNGAQPWRSAIQGRLATLTEKRTDS